MSVKIEIERKFLLKSPPKIAFDYYFNIHQFYLGKDKTRLRIVSQESKSIVYWKNIKNRLSDLSNEEIDDVITKDEFEELKKDAISEIRKRRLIKIVGNDKWEIDIFSNIQLIVAEVEIPSETYDLKIPDFISDNLIMEVSTLKEFSNRRLAVKL